ncbi:hypothetical protein WG915_00810 [Corynebacterium sp. H128]|uniref:hypothetical protein n=1 Tax=unclassified Corynebacterium TaxID=2624378 RepID=UPI0030AA7CE8
MKLISRKAITATIAAAAISTASLTAPAMAEETPAPAAPTADSSTNSGSSDTDFAGLSSDFFIKKDEDGKPQEMTGAEKFKEIITIVTGVGALFGALVTINNNIGRLMKSFQM